MTYAEFLADANLVQQFGEWWAEFYLTAPNGSPYVLRASKHGTGSPGTDITLLVGTPGFGVDLGTDNIAAHTPFPMRLVNSPSIQASIWQGNKITGRSVPAYGSVSLRNADGGLDQYHPRNGYIWQGGRVKFFFLNRYDRTGAIGKVFDGVIGQPKFKLDAVDIPLLGHESDFEQPMDSKVFRGSAYMLSLSGSGQVSFGTMSTGNTNITGDMTGEAWLYFNAMPTANLVFWGPNGASPWRLLIDTSHKIRLYATIGGSSEYIATDYTFTTDAVYHFAWRIVGRDVTFRIWDDDYRLLSVETHVNAFSSATRDSTPTAVDTLRTNSDATFEVWFDDVRIWNAARTDDEIDGNRNVVFQPGFIPSALVRYARMQDGTGTTVSDYSASNADGTASGAYTWLPSAEGGEVMAGKAKPLCVGYSRRVAPVLVDAARQIYRVSSGVVESIPTTDEGGEAHTMDTAAATYKDFLTASVAAGHSLPYPPRGLFKLGRIPTLPISAFVQGEYYTGTVEVLDDPQNIMLLLMSTRALYDGSRFDDALVTDLGNDEIAGAAVVGMFLPDPISVTISSQLDFVASAFNGWWGMPRGSYMAHAEVFRGPDDTADPDFTFTKNDVIALDELDVQQTVIYQIVVRFSKSHVVLDTGTIAAALIGTPAEHELRSEWLEEIKTDNVLRAQYPGKQSVPLVFETPLHDRYFAQLLAQRLMDQLGGAHYGYKIKVRSPAREAAISNLIALNITNINNETRYDLDGTQNYAALTVNDNKGMETVDLDIWR